MMLSRIFSLLLGTILFVLIWTMQDGNHATPRVLAPSELRTIVRRAEVVNVVPVVQAIQLAPTAEQIQSESALWMFAPEPAEQIAVK